MDLNDKKVILTGGASGIGKCLAEKLVNEGAILGVFDVNKDGLDGLQQFLPSVHCVICDVSDPRQVTTSVDDFLNNFGTIDVLVNNAGMIHNSLLVYMDKGKIRRYDTDAWDKAIAVNLSSVFYMTACVAEKMLITRTKGVIVNVGSICAAGNVGQSAYSAAKAGVNALTTVWANELGPLGIRVAGIAPGFTKTEVAMRSMSEDILREWTRKTPLRKMAIPSQIADGILFIIENDFFAGRILELDGGLRI